VIRVQELAQRVDPWLPRSGEPRKTRRQLVNDTGLRLHQLDAAVAHLRDDGPADSLVSSVDGIGYTITEEDVRRHHVTAIRYCKTRIRRDLTGNLQPYWEKRLSAAERDFAVLQFEHAFQNLVALEALAASRTP
jgi:hypothetical protein